MLRTSIQTSASDFEKSWTDATDAALEPEAPAYEHPNKKWRLKQGAMPHWYKARDGARTRALLRGCTGGPVPSTSAPH